MRVKESLILDGLINERAKSLAIEGKRDRMIKKAKVLEALIRCQEELDEIYEDVEYEEPTTNVGDINVTLNQGGGGRGNSGPAKPTFQPFDGGDLAASVGKLVKEEIRRS